MNWLTIKLKLKILFGLFNQFFCEIPPLQGWGGWVNVWVRLSLCIDHSSVITPALNGLTAMNIRYTSLYLVGQIWWASAKHPCRDRPCRSISARQDRGKPEVSSTRRTRERLRARRHLWPELAGTRRSDSYGEARVARNDTRYSPEFSSRLSWDPTHYVRVREVREGVTEAQQREASSPLQSGSSPAAFLHSAALDWTHVASFSPGCVFFLVAPSCAPPPPSLLENASAPSNKNVSWVGFSLHTFRTFLSRHLTGETEQRRVRLSCHGGRTRGWDSL